MKKRIALLAALMMCVSAGCGKLDDEETAAGNAPEAKGYIATTAEESEEAPEESSEAAESSEADGSSGDESSPESEPTAADSEVPKFEGVLNDDNCIILGLSHGAQDTRFCAELAVSQYDRIAAQDRQGYYDSIDIPALIGLDDFRALITGEACVTPVPERALCETAFRACADTAAGRQLAEYRAKRGENTTETGSVSGEFIHNVKDTIKELSESFTIDDAAPLFAEGSPYAGLSAGNGTAPDDFAAYPSKYLITPDTDALYIVDVFEESSAFSATAAEFDLYVLSGDIMYVLSDCSARTSYMDGVFNIYIGSAEITANCFAGRSADELRALFEEHGKTLARRNAVRVAYNSVLDGIWQVRSNQSMPWESVITDGYFEKSYSAEGLDISAEPHDQPTGDYVILKYLEMNGFTGGRVFVELTQEETETGILVRYTDPDGETVQYPDHSGRLTLTEVCGLGAPD